MVASRTSAVSSRSVITPSASAAAAVSAIPSRPRLSLRANRSSIRLTVPSPSPSSTRPATALQNSVPQPKPRRGRAGASIVTGNCGSASGVICTVPRAGRPASSPSTTTTLASSSRKVAGLRGFDRSVISGGLRSGTAAPGQGGCEAAPARPCRRAPAPADGSAGSGSRLSRPTRWRGRGMRH